MLYQKWIQQGAKKGSGDASFLFAKNCFMGLWATSMSLDRERHCSWQRERSHTDRNTKASPDQLK